MKSKISYRCYIKKPANIFLSSDIKIHAGATLDCSRGGIIKIGQMVTINRNVCLQASKSGITIADLVEINQGSFIDGTGGVSIAKNSLIGPDVKIISYTHSTKPTVEIRRQPLIAKPIHIGEDVWIGAGAIILANIADHCIIGAGAVVTKDTEPWGIYAGVPATRKKDRIQPDQINNLQ